MKLLLFACVAIVCLCLATAESDLLDYQGADTMTENGNYTFPAKNPCFILTARITYSVTPPGMPEGMLNGTIYDDVNITTVDAICPKDKGKTEGSYIKITNTKISQPVIVEFDFTKNTSANVWYGTKATITFPAWALDDTDEQLVMEGDAKNFIASADTGLQCSQVNISLTSLNGTKTADRIVLYNVKLMPGFVDITKPLETCDYDKSPKTSNVVPIAVGCALAGLVLIVLVAYLIGRTRHGRSTKGYQSV